MTGRLCSGMASKADSVARTARASASALPAQFCVALSAAGEHLLPTACQGTAVPCRPPLSPAVPCPRCPLRPSRPCPALQLPAAISRLNLSSGASLFPLKKNETLRDRFSAVFPVSFPGCGRGRSVLPWQKRPSPSRPSCLRDAAFTPPAPPVPPEEYLAVFCSQDGQAGPSHPHPGPAPPSRAAPRRGCKCKCSGISRTGKGEHPSNPWRASPERGGPCVYPLTMTSLWESCPPIIPPPPPQGFMQNPKFPPGLSRNWNIGFRCPLLCQT